MIFAKSRIGWDAGGRSPNPSRKTRRLAVTSDHHASVCFRAHPSVRKDRGGWKICSEDSSHPSSFPGASEQRRLPAGKSRVCVNEIAPKAICSFAGRSGLCRCQPDSEFSSKSVRNRETSSHPLPAKRCGYHEKARVQQVRVASLPNDWNRSHWTR